MNKLQVAINKRMTLWLLMTPALILMKSSAQVASTLQNSHAATARIIATDINSSGSGVFLTDTLVLTCLHVVTSTSAVSSNQVTVRFARNLSVVTAAGETVQADLVSMPSDANRAPLDYDFAFVRLRGLPRVLPTKVKLSPDDKVPALGEEVFFSGYPLDATSMVSLKGTIAGSNPQSSLIFVQAPVNKEILVVLF